MSRSRCRTFVALVLLGVGLASARSEGQVLAKTLLFNSVQPCRVADTRAAAAGILLSGTPRTFDVVGATTNYSAQGGVAGGCSIPGFSGGLPQVQAVAINIVAVSPAGDGFLKAWPSDQPAPLASTVNFQQLVPNLNIANAVILPVRQDAQGGDIKIVAGGANTHVLMDIVGYFTKAEPRKYYLTKTVDAKPGGEALTACATGYHMASLMEIFDTSNLSYNTSLGETQTDSGSGPPALFGWIRTGKPSWPGSGQVGNGPNCWAWTSSSPSATWGSVAMPSPFSWEDPATTVSPWTGHAFPCDQLFPSWCVEN